MLACAIVVILTAIAAAQQQPNPDAAQLFKEGHVLANKGKFKEACEKFEKSMELDPGNGTQLNIGNCHEQQGHLALAWRLFDEVADADKIIDPDRSKFARNRADALLPKLGVVIVKLAAPDAPSLGVSIAGRAVKPAPVITDLVDPGEVTILVAAPGLQPFQKREKIGAGKKITIEVPPLTPRTEPPAPKPQKPRDEGGAAVVPPVAEVPETPPAGPRRKSRVILAYSLGGVGALSLIVGVSVGLKARSVYNAQFDNGCYRESGEVFCSNDPSLKAQKDARFNGHIGTGFGLTGAALIGVGTYLFLTAPREVTVTPTATESSAGISVVGRF
jgi:hypothetical protein